MSRAIQVAKFIRQITRIPDAAAKEKLIENLLSSTEPRILAFINAHGLNLAWEKPEINALFSEADLLLRDGKGMEILDRRCDLDPGLNMNGTDFIPALLEQATGYKIALFGSRQPWLGRAEDKLRARGHSIVSTVDGFQDDACYVAAALETAPDIVVLAMGMPRQEAVAISLRAALQNRPVLLICGGAIVDFWAERFDRAPAWVQSLGMEWAYRLFNEPRRLFRRYVIGNFLFLARAKQIATASHSQESPAT